jgi:hypothetical protein
MTEKFIEVKNRDRLEYVINIYKPKIINCYVSDLIEESYINDYDVKKKAMILYYGIKYNKKVIFVEEKILDDKLIGVKRVKISDLTKNYPQNISEKFDMILENISGLYSVYGEPICFGNSEKEFINRKMEWLFLPNSDDKKLAWNVLEMMSDMGYFSIYNGKMSTDGSYRYLTVKAWNRIEELNKGKDSNKIFIAMSYASEEYLKTAYEIIKNAINFAGYKPVRLDDKEYNNYIPNEIEYEIRNSATVLVDLTDANNGAYFEAGIAHGIGKNVIYVCNEKEKDNHDKRVHFDVKQMNIIYYSLDNEYRKKELENRIIRRIKATI